MHRQRQSVSDTIRSGCNRVSFALRNFMRWQALPYQETAESKTGLFDGRPDMAAVAETLRRQYDLAMAEEHATRERYLEILSYLEWLDAMAAHGLVSPETNPLSWLDVGAKNWAYVD